MSQTIVQAAVKRILGDKILLGLIIVGVLLIFVGAFCTQDDSSERKKAAAAAEQQQQAPVSAQTPPAPASLDPQLATDFVKWWLTKSMDYNAQTARASHTEAGKWMSPTAATNFQACYWTQEIAQGVLSGQVSAAFQPMAVRAEAINPDGTVVVGVQGTLVIQSSGQPMTQQVVTDFLVGKDRDGLRIAGMFNRQVASAPPEQAQAPY